MPSVYQLKPAFQRLLTPLMRGLRSMGMTPNQLTLLAILLSAFMGFSIWLHTRHFAWILVVPIGYFIRMALNALDGMMATTYEMQSKTGQVLNELGDVLSDACIILPMALIPGNNLWLTSVIALQAMLNEFAGVLAGNISGTRRYDGPMGKSDRALMIGLFCLIYFFFPSISGWIVYLFCAMGILLIWSTINRLQKGIK